MTTQEKLNALETARDQQAKELQIISLQLSDVSTQLVPLMEQFHSISQNRSLMILRMNMLYEQMAALQEALEEFKPKEEKGKKP